MHELHHLACKAINAISLRSSVVDLFILSLQICPGKEVSKLVKEFRAVLAHRKQSYFTIALKLAVGIYVIWTDGFQHERTQTRR